MSTLTCIGILLVFCDLPPPPPIPPPVVVCPQVAPWSADKQKRLAAELEFLQPGSELKETLKEHIQLRDALRKCRAKPRAPSAR